MHDIRRPGARSRRDDGPRIGVELIATTANGSAGVLASYAAHASQGDALVIALVSAHHGRGRPLFDRGGVDLIDRWTECPAEVRDWVEKLYGAYGQYELMRADTQRAFGVHGLCWLEALVRCADMQTSREGD